MLFHAPDLAIHTPTHWIEAERPMRERGERRAHVGFQLGGMCDRLFLSMVWDDALAYSLGGFSC